MGAISKNVDANYLYNTCFKLIDYRGDVARGDGRYHEDYSPNNIKRLIISPDCIEVDYHVPIDGVSFGRTNISPYMLQKASCEDKYKAAIGLLNERVCSSVEEVILLTISNDKQYYLTERERDFSLLLGRNTKSSNIRDAIADRYKRLRYYTEISISFSEFDALRRNFKNSTGKVCECYSEMPELENYISVKESINASEDWYKEWGSFGATKVYKADQNGGILRVHFTNLIAKKTEELKVEGAKKLASERNKGIISDLEKAFKLYDAAFKLQAKLKKITESCSPYVPLKYNIVYVPPIVLYKTDGVGKNYPEKLLSTEKTGKEAIEENIKLCKNGIRQIAVALGSGLINSLEYLCDDYKVTLNLIMKDIETTVITSGCQGANENIRSITNKCFDGSNIGMSLVNSSWQICKYLVDSSSEQFRPEYSTKAYWQEVLK